MNSNKINFKVYRTRESTVIEITCGVLCLLLWTVTIVGVVRNKEAGAALIPQAAICTLLTPLMLFLAYKPETFNLPRNPVARHYELTVRLVRIVALECTLLFLGIALAALGWLPKATMAVLTTLITVTIIWYLVKMYTVKK